MEERLATRRVLAMGGLDVFVPIGLVIERPITVPALVGLLAAVHQHVLAQLTHELMTDPAETLRLLVWKENGPMRGRQQLFQN